MGVFSNIKNKIQEMFRRNKTKKLEEGSWINPAYYLPSIKMADGQSCDFRSIQYDGEFVHRDGSVRDLVIASINIGEEDATRWDGDNIHVAFEIAKGEKLNEVYCQKIVDNYLKQKENAQYENCLYIGEINGNPKDNTVKKSATIENYVNTEIPARMGGILKSKEEFNRRAMQQREDFLKKQSEEFDKRLHVNMEMEQEKKNERRQNPYLKQKRNEYRGADGNSYVDYNGVNLENGEVLKIRELNKVGKDAIGRYLYTAYLHSTAHEDDMEGKSFMVPVCFTTDKRVSDIAQGNNPNEIRNLLALLSKEENFKNNNGYMNDIGTLDRYGNITKGEDNSQELKDGIARLKQRARVRYQQERGQGQDGQSWTH